MRPRIPRAGRRLDGDAAVGGVRLRGCHQRVLLRRLLALDEGFSHIQVAVVPQARPLRRWAMTSFDVWGDMVSVELKRKEVRLREPEYVVMYVSLFEEMWAEAALGPELAVLIRDADQWLASLPQQR